MSTDNVKDVARRRYAEAADRVSDNSVDAIVVASRVLRHNPNLDI